MKLKYTVVIERMDDETDCEVYAPDVPGCTAVGKDWDDALSEMREALQSHIERLAKNGEPIPEPKTSDMDMSAYYSSDRYAHDCKDIGIDAVEVKIPPMAASG